MQVQSRGGLGGVVYACCLHQMRVHVLGDRLGSDAWNAHSLAKPVHVSCKA